MQRIPSIDLARGFTVFIMPAVHIMMLYSEPSIQQSFLGHVFAFLAEGPGAQLFMLLMGVSFVLSSRNTSKKILQRASQLLLAGYLLNFFKFVVPLGLGQMPTNVLTDLQVPNDHTATMPLLLLGDILHFAAIATLILHAISRLKYFPLWAAIIAVAIMLLSPMVWDVKTGFVFVDWLLALFNGHPPQVYFPVFPWIVYPLTGMTLGYLIKKYKMEHIIKYVWRSGFLLIVISLTLPVTKTITDYPSFYRAEPADTLFHLGLVLIWLAGFHWLSKKIPANPLFRLLTFCSRHITLIYFIQWILIFWCLAFTGYQELTMIKSVYWMLALTTTTFLLTYVLKKTNVQSKNI